MFRSILQDSSGLDDALSIITGAQRIKKYHYVIGDGDALAGVKIKAWAPSLNIWPDNDPADELYPNVLPNVVYATMNNPAAWSHLNTYYGSYDAARMIELSQLVHGGGNLMDVVYDATARQMWVAYAEGSQPAYQREYVHFDLNDYVFQDDFEDAAYTENNWWHISPQVTHPDVHGSRVFQARGAHDPTNLGGTECVMCAAGGKSYLVDGLRIGADIRVLRGWGGLAWGYQGVIGLPGDPPGASYASYATYFLGISPDDEVVAVDEMIAGADPDMAVAVIPDLELNAWYRVEVVSTATNFEVWLGRKGETLTKIIDVPQDVLHPGTQVYQVGAVGVYAVDDRDSIIQFDNFVVEGVPDATKHLACPWVRALREQPAVVPVWLNDAAGVAAFQFDLYYDATMLTGLTGLGVEKGALIADDADWNLYSSLIAPGHLRVLAYNGASKPLPAGSHGEVVKAHFTVNPAAVPRTLSLLNLEGVVLSDSAGNALPSGAWDGLVRIARAAEWFKFDPIASPQCGDPTNPLPFAVTIRAFDEYGDPGTLYNGTANLTDLTGTIAPTTAAFTSGVSTLDVTVGQPIASDQITATDAADSAVTGTSNAFQVIGKGDPTGDGEVNVLDVLRTVNFALELMTPSDAEFAAADANHDGYVNVLDVIIIQNMALGISGASAGGTSALQATRMQAAAAGGKAAPGGKQIAVPVLIDDAAGVAGFNLDLAYNAAALTPVEVRAGALLAGRADWRVTSNLANSPLRVLCYSDRAQPMTGGKGTLVEVIFTQRGGPGKNSFALSRVAVSDERGASLTRMLTLGKPYTVK